MLRIALFVLVALFCTVLCQPLDLQEKTDDDSNAVQHHVSRRFVNPMFALGGNGDSSVTKMRTKRQADECEKLALCKLHARSQRNFFAAFQLYFVNKENAKLWDHQARSIADCNERFGDCYE
ncbi:unnamed protein product [Spodoptera littoralis]|uniref:Uncharacterized protein n=1 Tax=Spodoptera littoralis TaxID=7109 RepID=A0A9P0MZU4_SPOLI|nr:unnamed protein product [Spodoptera littoralis]CAH1639425.1 unnamed protein product [Spodoptera littoralis]